MFKHFIVAFNMAAVAGMAQAATPVGDRLSRMELKECIAATHADEYLYTVELVGGSKVEIAKSPDGKPTSIRILHANGEESLVDSYDALAAKDAPAAGDADTVASDTRLAQRSQVRRVLSNHFRAALRQHCKRLQHKDEDRALTPKPGQRGTPDPSAEWVLWPELIESRDFWFNEARWQVDDTFYAGMDDWSNGVADWVEDLKDKQKDLPACSAVRDDCRATCDRVGAYAGGAVCGGLAAVASALSAGIGVSVGVYCGGRVLLKIEECRFNCVVPGVPCN